jgi:hypothetical protein
MLQVGATGIEEEEEDSLTNPSVFTTSHAQKCSAYLHLLEVILNLIHLKHVTP